MTEGREPSSAAGQRVALFITCLADLYRPEVGFAAVRLLEAAGYAVEVPAQGCCGQPNFNSGDRSGAAEIASGLMRRFAAYDYVVVPSGSCAAMIRCHFPTLFADDSAERVLADALAEKTHELTSFLHDIAGGSGVSVRWPATVTYHDGCSGLRELGIKQQPRKLLQAVTGLELREMAEADACCGFGGMFCVKYPEISNRIAVTKTRDIAATGADYVVTGETGCLLQIQGKLHRDGSAIQVVHIAEVLADSLDDYPASAETGAPHADD
jgi:L-lactate dehydrogenase complex protein LldE